MLAVIVAIATAAAVAAVWRLWWILPGRPGAPAPLQMNGSAKPGAALAPVRTIIVLGSGGHTTEMFALMAKLDRRRYLPRMYIVASTDSMGTSKVEDFESKGGSGSKPGHSVHIIPRSREVKQPWITTVWTTLLALVSSILLIARLQPDVVLCNGPGTCVPICVAAYLLRVCCFFYFFSFSFF